MTPVINPWVFYVFELATTLKVTSLILAGVTLAVGLGMWLCDESTKVKVCAWLCGVGLLIGVFVPSSNTVTKMVIAQNVTYERMETVTDTVETVYNDIMELFESNE
jgi:predicted membrane-bound spermidine synthase